MAFVVTDSCVKCKYLDCIEVCPVNCFHNGENMVVINPDECIDCELCEPECPVGAIKPESKELLEWLEINRTYSALWPKITEKGPALENADDFAQETDKFTKYFSPNPGE